MSWTRICSGEPLGKMPSALFTFCLARFRSPLSMASSASARDAFPVWPLRPYTVANCRQSAGILFSYRRAFFTFQIISSSNLGLLSASCMRARFTRINAAHGIISIAFVYECMAPLKSAASFKMSPFNS